MNRFFRAVFAALFLAFVNVTAPLSAQIPSGTNCTLPANSFGGSGISTSNVMCAYNGNIIFGMSGTQSYTSPPVTTDGIGNYFASTGSRTGAPVFNTGFGTWNFNYAIIGAAASDYFRLSVDLNPGVNAFSWYEVVLSGNNYDSSNLGYFGLAFDPNVAGQYSFKLAQCADAVCGSTFGEFSAININAGDTSVTPEPASMMLLATGLAGLGAAKRRRSKMTT